ncbi:hypothetical protein NST02_22055 [Robertmurraya sp. FSL W8-0741]|uniref:hypothetical protein n=1 Tax=Robertmurraya sp. FSL W8-0741 TaxID=2954629 RepID=UPI0030F8A272
MNYYGYPYVNSYFQPPVPYANQQEYLLRQPQDLGRWWQVEEGAWSGVWTRRGNSNVFDARWTRQGATPITAVMTVNVHDRFVSISRRNSSDGNDCQYVGIIEGNRVRGTNVCIRGGGTWSATIHRRPLQPDLGRRWEVQEGAWRGIWTRRGNSNTFDARWTRQGATPVTAVLTMTQEGNNVRILRRNSSDGNNCEYNGRIEGRRASGTFTCNQGGGNWTASIS